MKLVGQRSTKQVLQSARTDSKQIESTHHSLHVSDHAIVFQRYFCLFYFPSLGKLVRFQGMMQVEEKSISKHKLHCLSQGAFDQVIFSCTINLKEPRHFKAKYATPHEAQQYSWHFPGNTVYIYIHMKYTIFSSNFPARRKQFTWSVSSILKVIFPILSPTLLKSRMTPAPLNAEVLDDFGRSPSFSRKSTKSPSILNSRCLAVRFKYLSSDARLFSMNSADPDSSLDILILVIPERWKIALHETTFQREMLAGKLSQSSNSRGVTTHQGHSSLELEEWFYLDADVMPLVYHASPGNHWISYTQTSQIYCTVVW